MSCSAAKKAKDYEYAQRIRALLLLGSEGKRGVEVAEMPDVSESAVYLWQRKFRKHGISGLRDDYKPRKSILSKLQHDELRDIVVDGPEAAGFDTGTWTAELVGDGIKEKFGVAYSISAVVKILHRLNFSVQLPQVLCG